MEESKVAMIGIIVENTESAARINAVLHEYGAYIIGRMGIPYRERHMSIISVVVDAPGNIINSLSGKIGMLPGVSSKVMIGRTPEEQNIREGHRV